MQISQITIRKTFDEGNLKAVISITLDNCLAIHEIKVIQGHERLFVAMPSRFDDNGQSRDIVHPINFAARETLEKLILTAYENHVATQAAIKSEDISA